MISPIGAPSNHKIKGMLASQVNSGRTHISLESSRYNPSLRKQPTSDLSHKRTSSARRRRNFGHPRAFMSMPQHENADRSRAERLFKTRQMQKADAPKATADYYAAEQALRDRTRELRQLRLAQEKRDLVS